MRTLRKEPVFERNALPFCMKPCRQSTLRAGIASTLCSGTRNIMSIFFLFDEVAERHKLGKGTAHCS
jgi:hypothetical protein